MLCCQTLLEINVILPSCCTYIDKSEKLKWKQKKIFYFETKIMATKYTHKHFITMEHHINLTEIHTQALHYHGASH